MEKSIFSAHNYFWGIRWGARLNDWLFHTRLFIPKERPQPGQSLRDGYFECLVGESNKEQWYTNGCSYFLRSYPRCPLMLLWNIASDGVTEALVVKVEWRVSDLHVGGEGGRPMGHSMWEGIGFVWTNDQGWQCFFCLVCLCYWAAEQPL